MGSIKGLEYERGPHRVPRGLKGFDWKKVREEYETTDITPQALADKYGIGGKPLRRRAKSEGWKSPRHVNGDLQKDRIYPGEPLNTNRVTLCFETPEPTDLNTRHLILMDKIITKCEQIVNNELYVTVDGHGNRYRSPVIIHQKLKAVVEILEKTQRGHRICEGLLDEIEKQKLVIEKEKLEIIKSKFSGNKPEPGADDGFIDALNASAKEVWKSNEV